MLLDYQIFLDDVFSNSPSEKFKMLESNQDKIHSISSHRSLDKHYLEKLIDRRNMVVSSHTWLLTKKGIKFKLEGWPSTKLITISFCNFNME